MVKRLEKKKTISFQKEKEKKFTLTRNKKLLIVLIITLLLLLALLVRIGFLQFVQGSDLKEKMYRQLVTSKAISPKRGSILDTNYRALARSAAVDTVTINPTSICSTNSDEEKAAEETKALKEKVAKAFSEIFELDYEETLAKVSSDSSIETIAKKVEQDKVDELRNWMEENEIYSGINIDEDTKRYYPYDNLASNLIGFCGSDNDGRWGLEYTWDDVLTGTPGKIVTSEDAVQEVIPDKDERYVAPENGSNIVLTLDVYIQSIVEKYLEQAVIENNAGQGGIAMVMDPKTGDILASATYPDYNLNDPNTINDEEIQKAWNNLSSSEQYNYLSEMWRDKCISSTYEPGSTFKIINSAIALEEQVTTPDVEGEFNCIGYEMVAGLRIHCWSSVPHGPESLREALEHSCNPSFMQLGKKMGADTMYRYYDALNLLTKTGVKAYAEESAVWWDLDDVGEVELATMSFGQRFNITPLQLVSAVSAVVNDGTLMRPRIVKEIINADDGSVTTLEPEEVRQVFSKETSKTMREMLESVVVDGTGKHAAVTGYSIGGKSGTTEPLSENEDGIYIASFIGVAPIESPEVVVLVAIYDPQDEDNGHQGGLVAGPVVSQILSEVLPYLGVASNEESTEDEDSPYATTTLKDVTNKTAKEAISILEEQGFEVSMGNNGDKNSIVITDQVPKAGTPLIEGSVIKLYTKENDTRISTTVPNLKGMGIAQAINALKAKNLNIRIEGTSGIVVSQDPILDTQVEEGTVVNVTFKQEISNAY